MLNFKRSRLLTSNNSVHMQACGDPHVLFVLSIDKDWRTQGNVTGSKNAGHFGGVPTSGKQASFVSLVIDFSVSPRWYYVLWDVDILSNEKVFNSTLWTMKLKSVQSLCMFFCYIYPRVGIKLNLPTYKLMKLIRTLTSHFSNLSQNRTYTTQLIFHQAHKNNKTSPLPDFYPTTKR